MTLETTLVSSRSDLLNGTLEIVTQRGLSKPVRQVYVFKRERVDFPRRYVVEAYTINFDTHLIDNMGFQVVDRPVDGFIEVWADGTDMPQDMAKAFVNHLYPETVVVWDHSDISDIDNTVISYVFEVVN